MRSFVRTGLVLGFASGVLLFAGRVRAMPTINATSPANDSVVNDTFTATANVTSPFVVTAVTATVGGVTKSLTQAGAASNWSAPFDISGEPLGPATMQVIAYDANGESATTTVALKHDHPPKLTVLTPSCSVGTPSIRLQATCEDTDPYGCATITAHTASTNTPTLDQNVDFSAYTGTDVLVTFTATDTAGMKSSQTLLMYGPPATTAPAAPWVFAGEVAGRVLDVDATRILFTDCYGVKVKSRVDGTISTLGPDTMATVTQGHLSSVGAIWNGGDSVNGTYAARTTPAGFSARGDWAAWAATVDTTTTLYRENLATGAVQTLAQSGAGGQPLGVDVDVFGNAAFTLYTTTDFFLHRVSTAGNDTVLTNSGVGGIIDDTNVVYTAHSSTFTRPALFLDAAGTVTTLDTLNNVPPAISSYRDYRANDGWVAYRKLYDAMTGSFIVNTRAPNGTIALASAYTNVARIDGLSATGEVAYVVGTTRYLSSAGVTNPTPAFSIGPAGSTGRDLRSIGADWYEIAGRNVYRLDRSGGQADAGADAGSNDAGIDAGVPDASVDAAVADATSDAGDAGSSSSGSSGASSGGASNGSSGTSSGAASSSSGSGGTPDSSDSSGGGAGDDGGCISASSGDSSAPLRALVLAAAVTAVVTRRRRPRR